MKTIWCLLSICNEYNQPDNNLECFWFEKPDIHSLVDKISLSKSSEAYKTAKIILRGEDIRWGESDYRLKEVKENERL